MSVGNENTDYLNSAMRWLINNEEFDGPVMFPWSTNYETWIWKNDLGICVDTCNNHEWYDLFLYDYQNEDWKFDSAYDEFCNGWDTEYLDLSNMKKTRIGDFVPLHLRKNER